MEWSFGHHVCQGLHGKARASISISICCTRSVPSFFCRVGLAWIKANSATSRLGKDLPVDGKGLRSVCWTHLARAAVCEITNPTTAGAYVRAPIILAMLDHKFMYSSVRSFSGMLAMAWTSRFQTHGRTSCSDGAVNTALAGRARSQAWA